MRLTLSDPVEDPDALPRRAPVGSGSAFSAVSVARPVAPKSVEVRPAGPRTARRERPLRTWSFLAGAERAPAPRLSAVLRDGEAVSIPDCWSRRDPSLADFRGAVCYAREVTTDADHARLVFDRLDYLARIDVDGRRAATHEGGFTPVSVELPPHRSSRVLVRLDDPLEPVLLDPSPLMKPKAKIKGVQEQHDSRPGGMAWGPDFSRTWGRRWGTGGIAGEVRLHESGRLRLVAVFVTATPGQLRLSWVVENLSEATDAVLSAAVAEQGEPGETSAPPPEVAAHVQLPRGASRVSLTVAVRDEQTWAPDHPHLYSVHAQARLGDEVSDSLDVGFGFRHVDMAVEGSQAFHLTLNGRRTYVRAANYIPGVWPSEWERRLIARDVELARAANLNSFGVHAGVCLPVVEEADRQGLLIYQDFPLQWSYDCTRGPIVRGGPTFADASLQLATELLYLLHNHPSVVYWCAHNEPGYQLAELFTAVADTPEVAPIYQDMVRSPNEENLDRRRLRRFQRVDPSRPAVHASGLGATRRSGDVHDYAGSLSGGSVGGGAFGSKHFISEYGSWSANFSAAARMVAARGDWPPPERVVRSWHEQTHLVAVQNTYAGRPERFEDFPTWCFAGQLWAGWNAKVATELCRLSRFAPSGGQRYHFFLDHWGDGGAGVVDRFRSTGPAFRGLAAANRPVVALARWPGRVAPGAALSLVIRVINDLHEPRPGLTLRWRLAALAPDDGFVVGRDDPTSGGPTSSNTGMAPADQCAVLPRSPGSTLLEGSTMLDLSADSAVDAAECAWTADHRGPIALFMDLEGVVSWTSFVVEPDGWSPPPGLTGPSRFTVTSEVDGPLRRRWTGEEVDPRSAPPDQYRLGALSVDVYDDTHVDAQGVVTSRALPWPDPLARDR